MPNESALLFRPEPITVKLGEETYRLVYDLNAFCELEKIYDSVDDLLQALLGGSGEKVTVTHKSEEVDAADIEVNGTPLPVLLGRMNKVRQLKHSDTLNLLWAGCLHDNAVYEHDEIVGYTVSKTKLGSLVTIKNLPEVNLKVVAAILRDLVPDEAIKNADAPAEVPEKPHLVLKQ